MDYSSLEQDNFDVFEDWQDLSQYSYDPEDRLDTLTLPDSQPSSQESEKLDVFLGMAEDKPGLTFNMEDAQSVSVVSLEVQPTATKDTGDLAEYSLCPTSVTGWLATPDDNGTVSNSQELQSVLWWEDNSQGTFDIQEVKPEEVKSEAESEASVIVLPSSPTVTSTELSDNQLLSLPTRELNRRLQSLSAEERNRLKHRRRTLKNRGYAQTCRTRRVTANHKLQDTNESLVTEVHQLREKVVTLTAERDHEVKQRREQVAALTAERDHYRSQFENLLETISSVQQM